MAAIGEFIAYAALVQCSIRIALVVEMACVWLAGTAKQKWFSIDFIIDERWPVVVVTLASQIVTTVAFDGWRCGRGARFYRRRIYFPIAFDVDVIV